MEPEIIGRKEYPSFGECIYCGRKPPDIKLTDEHVVPFSLGANAVILDGSCTDCAAQTGKIEGSVGRGSLWDYRTHIGEQTYRPRERQKTIPFTAVINGVERRFDDVPAGKAPFFTPYPVWGPPGILTGEEPAIQFVEQKAHVFYWIPPDIKETLGLKDLDEIRFPFPKIDINLQKWGRAVAKMGYCHAVLRYGLHGFLRLETPELILGKCLLVPYYVGCSLEDPPPVTDASIKHVTNLKEAKLGGRILIIATVRLYSNSGTDTTGPPIYEAVVGALPP